MTPTILHIAAGRDHSLALLGHGEVWGWGAEGSGRTTLPEICSIAPPSTPIVVPATQAFTRITAGYGTSYGITNTNATLGWGVNRAGMAGRPDLLATLRAEPLPHLPPLSQIAVSEYYGLALTTQGQVLEWGLSRGGPKAVRNMGLNPISLPAPAHQIAVGPGHALALTEQKLYAWGANAAGQLGQGHLVDQKLPVAVPFEPGLKLQSVAAGASHNLALDEHGRVWAWGSNQYGQLGTRAQRYSASPLLVELNEPVQSLAAGMFFSLALGQSGQVYSWGWNAKGQLGRSNARYDAQPLAIPELAGITQIAAGQAHALAATTHALFAWGDNESNQLGPNGPANRDPENPGWSASPVSMPV